MWLLIVIYFSMVALLYTLPGHHPYVISAGYSFSDFLIAMPFWLLGFILFQSVKGYSPISIFCSMYFLLVYVPYFLFFSIKQHADLTFAKATLVSLPMFIALVQSKINFKSFDSLALFKDSSLDFILAAIGLISASLTVFYAPNSASFSLVDVYERRLEARGIYVGGIAYLNETVMNSVIPFLAFRSFYKRKVWLSIVTFGIVASFFYSYGVKSPFVVMLFAFACGFLAGNRYISMFVKISGASLLGLAIMGYVEFFFLGYSNIVDYVFRRLHFVVVYNIESYLEVFAQKDFSWVGLWGMGINMPASVYIGEIFLESKGLNANSNTFMYSLIQFGLPGYIVNLLSVWAILIFFSSWKESGPAKNFIVGIFCLMIMEKSLTTSLLSSGIFLLILLYFLSGKKATGAL